MRDAEERYLNHGDGEIREGEARYPAGRYLSFGAALHHLTCLTGRILVTGAR